MSQQVVSVFILYAPGDPSSDPDDCAAFQYSVRAKESLLSTVVEHQSWNVTISCIEESSFENLSTSMDETTPKVLALLILSCSADGSIHRELRKAAKQLGKHTTTSCHPIHLGVALLGHARCENSAKQMKQTIFGSGRRIEKALLATSNSFVSIQERLETQVELVEPKVEFDPWWSSVIEQFQTSSP